jgi:hypothetical protein
MYAELPTARRSSRRFWPFHISIPFVRALTPLRSAGIAARGKPAALKRTTPGTDQQRSIALCDASQLTGTAALAPRRGNPVLLK